MSNMLPEAQDGDPSGGSHLDSSQQKNCFQRHQTREEAGGAVGKQERFCEGDQK